ncbi:MAG: sphingosine kinase [Actinobacteria bacterium]|nr:sphingosine kinase [Actinomycetota bacterium]
MIQRVDFIVNPRAGKGRASTRAAEAARLLTDAGVACGIHVPTSGPAAAEIAERAARPGTCVVACGGDGTVHWTLQGVMRGDAVFDILATGTGNDIHAALHGHEPDPVRSVVRRLLSGSPRLVDVGCAKSENSERFYLAVCTTGFDSVVNLRANGITRGPSQARYVAALLSELPALRARTWRITQGDTTWQDRGVILAIANGGIYGGGMRISPHASVTDGLLDVTLVGEVGRLRLVGLFPLVYSGAHVHRPEVSTWSTRAIDVEGDEAPVMCDGEYLGDLPVSVRSLPGALRVCASPVA